MRFLLLVLVVVEVFILGFSLFDGFGSVPLDLEVHCFVIPFSDGRGYIVHRVNSFH